MTTTNETNQNDEQMNDQNDTSTNLLHNLQQRAASLLAELRAYQSCLQANSKQKEVEIRTYKRGIESEVKTLNAVSLTQEPFNSQNGLTDFEIEELESKRHHALRSSNLPFYEALWTVARQCRGITALGKRVYSDSRSFSPRSRNPNIRDEQYGFRSKDKKRSAVVDIIAEDGLKWIKVSTITEKRLLFEMAKEGWEGYGDVSSGEERGGSGEENGGSRRVEDDEAQLEIVKMARVLYSASRECRVQFKHPLVVFVLPKVQEGLFQDVDAVIADIRSIGIQVICGNYTEPSTTKNTTEELSSTFNSLNLTLNSTIRQPSETSDDLTHLLPTTSTFSPQPTPTLNIDCTILLALISDISHIPSPSLPPHPSNTSGTYHKAISRQIDTETATPLLPTELYPVLQNHDLVCTNHAAQRMREIVLTMGTESERARADIILGENTCQGLSTQALQLTLAKYSCRDVPANIQLPLRIVDSDDTSTFDGEHLSSADERLIEKVPRKMNLSVINESVFLYGWRMGMVTVTSNRAVAAGLVKCINEVLDEEEEEDIRRNKAHGGKSGQVHSVLVEEVQGPKIYVCETARSLIGKEKQGGSRG